MISGATFQESYVAWQLIEEAASRAGITPEKLTPEIGYKAIDQLNLIMTSLLNRGFQLWKKQPLLLPCYVGVNQAPLPPGYNLVTSFQRRSLFRASGTSFTDAGGDASFAFDDNFDTACTQTSANGSLGQQFTSATFVTIVGILSSTPGSWIVSTEWSNDGATWTTVDSHQVLFSRSGEWTWYELGTGPINGATYWRLRTEGVTPFSATEIFFGNTPADIPFQPWNIDDYTQMPNKNQGGQVVGWYQQRDISGPKLYLWPTPNYTARYDILYIWATQYLDQVTQISQSLDFPPRWNEAVTAMLATKMCWTLPEADRSRMQDLERREREALWLAESEERDPSPVQYDLGVDSYTSG